MDINQNFETDICWVLEASKKRIQSYNPCMSDMGISYMEKRHILDEKGKRSCEAYWLTPFWLQDTFNLDQHSCRTISLATVYMVLYFLSQDEVMDSSPDDYKGYLLPLSNMFYFDFISQYRTLFDSDSPFWLYVEKYTNEWAESVLWERREHWGQAENYSENDLILLSRKAAGIKIPFAAACILSGNESYIESLSDMVDYDQVVYQLYDDWRDWKVDLEQCNYTYFLTEAKKYCNISEPSLLKEEDVKKAIFEGKVLQKVLKISEKFNNLASESIANINSVYLKNYIDNQKKICIDNPIRDVLMDKYGITSIRLGSLLRESDDD